MEKRWELASDVDPQDIEELSRSLDLPPVIAKILVQRGFDAPDGVDAFFYPNADALHSPFLFKDMDVAVERIIEALREKQRIMVYGDYDVDGITSVSLLYMFFRDLGGEVEYYIPDRQSEGYGLSISGIERAAEDGVQLIVTVDCGITSVEEAKAATRVGIDLIISDHHQPAAELPAAYAIINPKLVDNEYPFTDLAGVGVAYKLAQGVVERLELPHSTLEPYLDLVAVGTAADIVPLKDENRIFVYLGLEKINREPLVGVQELIETANLPHGRIEVGQIIYGLAPRMNAVGRLGNAGRAVQLMITADSSQGLELAKELEKENTSRKQIDAHTLAEAQEHVEEFYDPNKSFSIVLAKENWHSGVIGIVASRLIEKYFRPTVMITIENGVGKGSARSIPGFDIYDAMQQCSDLMLQFGGHTYAAGLTLLAENIPEFRKRFNEVVANTLKPEDMIPKLKIDSTLDLHQISFDFLRMLKRFAPFGPHNPRPVFVSYNVQLSGYPRVVGNNHLKFQLKRNGPPLDCIGFNLGDRIHRLDPIRATNHIVYTIEENVWNGQTYLQLRVKDVKSDKMANYTHAVT
ncbi:single-stranded-DNA-specific exonuclease RecJ [bacterium]|nr:single-stranded-DNA-specific exonuclease RecJ [bacterium]